MSDRPVAAVLAALAAIMFVGAFSAAAVLRPDRAVVSEEASARTSPAAAQESRRVVTIDVPALSAVAALPALHLPKPKPKPKKKKKRTPKKVVSKPAPARTTPPPAATPRPPAYTPPAPQTPRYTPPPRRQTPTGTTFDTSG